MEGGSKLPRIVAEPDTADADFEDGVGSRSYGDRRSSANSLTDGTDGEEGRLPHLGRTDHKKYLAPSSSGANSKSASSAFASSTTSENELPVGDDYDDEEEEEDEDEDEDEDEEDDSFERVDIGDMDDDHGDYGDESRREDAVPPAAAGENPTRPSAAYKSAGGAVGGGSKLSANAPRTRPGTAVPETLEEAIRHYHSVLEEAEKIGVETALSRITYSRGYDKRRTDNRDELMELARHETLRRLTRLTSELFHRSLETKQIYQLVHETVMSTQARVKQLERQLESYEILRRHKEEDEADLTALKERIRKVERIALKHAPLNDGGLLDAIEELKNSHIDTQKKHKKRRRKEEMIAAGEAVAVSPSMSSSKSPSKLSIASNRSPRLP